MDDNNVLNAPHYPVKGEPEAGFSGYIDLFDCLYNFFVHQKYSRENKNGNSDNLTPIESIVKDFTYSKKNLTTFDIVSVASIILSLFVLKKLLCDLTNIITNKLKYNRKDSERLKESIWKLSFYLLSSSVLFYICVIRDGSQYFLYPERIWTDYSADSTSIDMLEKGVYLFQLAFYTYSMHATLFEDEWRKDSPVLLMHHIICSILLFLSSVTRTHRSGILVLFLHDPCDVILEFTKILMVVKVRDGRVIKAVDRATSVSFVIFTVVWITNRLYHYPITLMYFTLKYNMQQDLYVPFYGIINTLLTIILAMNLYWFTFIMKLAIKMVLSDPEGLVDIREYDAEDNSANIKDQLVTNDENKTSSSIKTPLILETKLDPLQEEEEEEVEVDDDGSTISTSINKNMIGNDENNNQMNSVSSNRENGDSSTAEYDNFDMVDREDITDLNGNIILSSEDSDSIDAFRHIDRTAQSAKMYYLRDRKKSYLTSQYKE